MLLVEIADAGTDTPALEPQPVAEAERLEPRLLGLDLAVGHGKDRLATPERVDVGLED